MSSISGGIDGVEVRFDEGSLVGDAGLLLAGTVMDRLGLEAMLDEVVRPPGSGRGSGAKALSLVASMLVGGSFIDDADRLRAGSTAQVLPFRPASTLGTWLRSFTLASSMQSVDLHGREHPSRDLDAERCDLACARSNIEWTQDESKHWEVDIAYTRGGQAQVAETTIKTGPRSRSAEPRDYGSWCDAPASPAPKPKSCEKLLAAAPISRSGFENQLRDRLNPMQLNSPQRTNTYTTCPCSSKHPPPGGRKTQHNPCLEQARLWTIPRTITLVNSEQFLYPTFSPGHGST